MFHQSRDVVYRFPYCPMSVRWSGCWIQPACVALSLSLASCRQLAAARKEASINVCHRGGAALHGHPRKVRNYFSNLTLVLNGLFIIVWVTSQ